MKRVMLIAGLATAFCAAAVAQDKKNFFQDPFLRVTSAIPNCPMPEPPGMTEQELREAAHVRAQAGVSCHTSGRCRLANSYLYDKEIAPRMVQFIQRDGHYDDTSLWVLVERRYVYLKGCVKSPEQSAALERAAGTVDDVMGVVNELSVGTQEKPRYAVAPPAKK
ncbi:BON domain-containing protein [Ramlibacter sp.]|uniref:BON domain-containing protein n=1 Tax=Ramlibacter sp. TaxID=1917967 RepID=UPI0017A892F4|nr:BON domain-containing protein [Ramlibacter sp.]MBA2672423.1 BON domain-containing protein [Ramlibacter sp.]